MSRSLAPNFYVKVYDQSYNVVAIFDNWVKLEYSKIINNVGVTTFSIDDSDTRSALFELDGIFEVYRSVPGLGVDWYREYIGLFRGPSNPVESSGLKTWTANIVSLEDFLARTTINYKAGTIFSYKKIAAETAMKEYVEENCGASATVVAGRLSDGVLPDFLVDTDLAAGAVWEGDKAYENLLDTLRSIADFANMDYTVTWSDATNKFTFITYLNQLGVNRTTTGLNPATGKNAAGYYPVIFSLDRGNMASLVYSYNRTSESNVVTVMGDGDGATRVTRMRSTTAATDSPWNRREIARPQGGFLSQMDTFGDEVLESTKAIEEVSFVPLFQESCMYGKDFFFGDSITVRVKGVDYNRRLVEIKNTVTKDGEHPSFVFSSL